MNPSAPRFAELLEYAYRLDGPAANWQNRLNQEISERMPNSPGLLSYEFDMRTPGESVGLGRVVPTGEIDEFAAHTQAVHDELKTDAYRTLAERLGTHAATIKEAMGRAGVDVQDFAPVQSLLDKLGYEDIWGICSMNPNGLGIAFAVPLFNKNDVDRLDRRAWTRLGVHIAAAHRLQGKLKQSPTMDDAAGIFRRDGRAVELKNSVVNQRESLRRFIRAVDKARADDYRRGEERSIDVWRGLLNGRWSLVDHIDSDGTRFMLVVENDPAPEGERAVLTHREAQVASYAALGHMNKEIAYELGLSISTIASHLSKALSKLGLNSRTELVWLRGRLQGA